MQMSDLDAADNELDVRHAKLYPLYREWPMLWYFDSD
jgi:hypothetical protein